MVKNRRNGILLRPDVSPELFAKRLAGLLRNRAQWRRFSVASTRIAREFSEAKQARRLTRLYESLVDAADECRELLEGR